MIDFISPEKYFNAKHIWMTCFGDNDEYTDFIFSRLITPDKVLAFSNPDGQVVGMLCLQPFTLQTLSGTADVVYIFGVATLPQWRGKGIASQLLRETQNRMSASDVVAAVLVPAGEKMFPFYEKHGFQTAFSVQKKTYTVDDLPRNPKTCVLKPAILESLIDIRNRHFGDRTLFVSWNTDYLKYIGQETRALDGDVFTVNCEDASGYVVCYPYKDLLIIKELTLPAKYVADVVAALHIRFGKEGYRLHLPDGTLENFPECNASFAMLKWYDSAAEKQLCNEKGEASYIAHVLDGPTLGVALKSI